jgi:hypothetical protein
MWNCFGIRTLEYLPYLPLLILIPQSRGFPKGTTLGYGSKP